SALWLFWGRRGHWREGLARLTAALARIDKAPASPEQARAWCGVGYLHYLQGDYAAAKPALQTALQLAREVQHEQSIALSLLCLGIVTFDSGDLAQARSLHEQGLEIYRRSTPGNDKVGNIATALAHLGLVVGQQGDYALALTHLEESLRLRRELGDKRGV